MRELLVYKLDEEAVLPTKAYDTDAAYDLYAIEDVTIPPQTTMKVKTGVAIRIIPGYVGLIKERSSMGSKGISVRAGVVDSLYSGEWCVFLTNLNRPGYLTYPDENNYVIKKGDRIAQFLIQEVKSPEVLETTQLWGSARGNKGLGSSGR